MPVNTQHSQANNNHPLPSHPIKPKMIDPTTLRAREYTPADRDTCLRIFDSNHPKYFADEERAMFAEWLDKPDRASYLVVELENAVVACGGIYHDTEKNHAGLAWGMVQRERHGQGIGRFLTRIRVEQMSNQFPALKQHLGTSQHTFGFYEKMGFVTTKVTPDGFGPGIDRYDMVKEPS